MRFSSVHVRRGFPLAAILVLAMMLRLASPGLYHPWLDEVGITDPAIRLAREGAWTWVGAPSAWAGLSYHSPYATYVTAFFYTLSPDLQAGRIGYGLLGVLAVGGMYLLTQHVYGRKAGLVAALLLAAAPTYVDWSRYVYNPSLALPALPFWALTAILGYHEGKRWAQIAHWLLLSACFQSQAALVILVPVSVLAVFYRLIVAPRAWRSLIMTTLMAALLVSVTLIPWGIGLSQSMTRNPSGLGWQMRLPSVTQAATLIGTVVSGLNFQFAFQKYSLTRPLWWATSTLNVLFWLHTALLITAWGWAAYRGLRKPRQAAPELFFAVASLMPFALLMVGTSGHNIENFYFMSLAFTLTPPFAAGVIRLSQKHVWRGWLVGTGLVLLVGACVWVCLTYFDWLGRDGWRANKPSLDMTLTQFMTWRDGCGDDLIYFQEFYDEGIYTRKTRDSLIRTLSFSQPMRMMLVPQGIPVSAGGTTVFAAADAPYFQERFPDAQTALPGQDDSVHYRWVCLEPEELLKRSTPVDINYGDALHVIGIQAASAPRAETPWRITLLWQPQVAQPAAQYQFSLRLVDTAGNTLTQSDGPTLSSWLWRPEDTVINELDLIVPESLPPLDSLHLRLIVYALEGGTLSIKHTDMPLGAADQAVIPLPRIP